MYESMGLRHFSTSNMISTAICNCWGWAHLRCRKANRLAQDRDDPGLQQPSLRENEPVNIVATHLRASSRVFLFTRFRPLRLDITS